MTSRKVLLEAQAFERRRLLGALVGGAPDGDAARAPRSTRPLLGGTLVAVLASAGTAALELLR